MHSCSSCSLRKDNTEFSCRQIRSKALERKCRSCNDSIKEVNKLVKKFQDELRKPERDETLDKLVNIQLIARRLTFLTCGNCDFCENHKGKKKEERTQDDMECVYTVEIGDHYGVQLCKKCAKTYDRDLFHYLIAKHGGMMSMMLFKKIICAFKSDFESANFNVLRSAKNGEPAYYQSGWRFQTDYCLCFDRDNILDMNVPVLLLGSVPGLDDTTKTNKLFEFCEGNGINCDLINQLLTNLLRSD
jgi:hypothetical protein